MTQRNSDPPSLLRATAPNDNARDARAWPGQPAPPLMAAALRPVLSASLTPGRAERERVRSALNRALSEPSVSGTVERVDAAMAARAASLRSPSAVYWLRLKSRWLISGFLLSGGVAAWLLSSPQPAPVATHALDRSAVAAPAAVPEPDQEAQPPLAAAPLPANPPLKTTKRATRTPRRAPVVAELAPPPLTAAEDEAPPPQPVAEAPRPSHALAEELRLIESATTQLTAHNPLAALRRLDEHDQRYAHGALEKEARALRVMALCESHAANASAARTMFLRLEASSPLADRVQSACAEIR